MVKIIVEGIADVVFIRQYLKHLYGVELDKDSIIRVDGWESIRKDEFLNQLRHNSDDAGINLVVFDADNDCDTRRAELQKIAQDNSVSFNLFLFPNDVDSGTLETLLMKIINPENQSVVECWDRYENDLQQQTIPWKSPTTPTVPSIKTRVYAYLEALVGESKSQKKLIKEADRKYDNPNHWDLDSQELNPLKTFFDNCFVKS